jgi:hypothetical protein
MLAMNF